MEFIVEFDPWILSGLVGTTLNVRAKLVNAFQMQMLIKEVGTVLISRPLVYIGEDIYSRISLMPGHFLSLNPRIGILEAETASVFLVKLHTAKVSVDFTVKQLATSCQQFPVFLQAPVNISRNQAQYGSKGHVLILVI